MNNIKSRFVKAFVLLPVLCIAASMGAQSLHTGNNAIDKAFKTAIGTIDKNITDEGLILAGGAYGGEWTRDCAINNLNATSLLRPIAAEHSLWSVTNNRNSVGHQYWDKIIWIVAAWDHYKVTGDISFLKQAFRCAKNTIEELEGKYFNERYGLFTGPAVFQDGIAAYDEPIYQPGNMDSYVLNHDADNIMCLSTNCIYFQAFNCFADMAWQLNDEEYGKLYQSRARKLKNSIREHLYDKKQNKLYYLIDQNGKKHDYTEALGVAFAVLYEVVNEKEAKKIINNVYITKYGVPCVYPAFPRYNEQRPGRHNVMIWPHVNMFFASACAHVGLLDKFYSEIHNLASLVKTSGGFYEIYDPATGKPSGGYQSGHLWGECHDQTWCATGYVRQFLYGVFGIKLGPRGLRFRPLGMDDGSTCTIKGIRFHNNVINITVKGNGDGSSPKSCKINGQKASNSIGYDGSVFINGKKRRITGDINIEFEL